MDVLRAALAFPRLTPLDEPARTIRSFAHTTWAARLPCATEASPELHNHTAKNRKPWRDPPLRSLACVRGCFRGVFDGRVELGDAHAKADQDRYAQQIKQLLDTRVRPAVAMDGGDIVFQDFEDGIVTLQMRGACQGCPSSTATLKMGIENMLRHYIPEVREVRSAEL